MKHVEVRRELAAVAQKGLEAAGLSVERTLHELACVAYADPRGLFGPDGRGKRLEEVDKDTVAPLAHVELDSEGRITSFRFCDKNAALGMALRHLGLFERDNRQNGQSYALQVVIVGGNQDPEPDRPAPSKSYPGIEVVTQDPAHPYQRITD